MIKDRMASIRMSSLVLQSVCLLLTLALATNNHIEAGDDKQLDNIVRAGDDKHVSNFAEDSDNTQLDNNVGAGDDKHVANNGDGDDKQLANCTTGYKLCANNTCCCSANKAVCFKYTLNYIPAFPESVTVIEIQGGHHGGTLLNFTRKTFQNITRVKRLYLRDFTIPKLAEDAFVNLSHIEVLDLSYNRFINKSELPISFESIKGENNISLILAGIELQCLYKGFFRYLNHCKVTHIDLSDNRLSDLYFEAFETLPYLQELRIRRNWMDTVHLPLIPLTSLTDLDVGENWLRHNIPLLCSPNATNPINYFPSLTTLNLHENGISELSQNNWACLDTLINLDLSGNHILKLNMSAFVSLPNLETLDVRFNWIQDVIKEPGLKRLKHLNLGYNELAALPPRMCSNETDDSFPVLETLNITSNLIYVLNNTFWYCLRNLKTLDISNNVLKSIRNNTFDGLMNLEELLISKTFNTLERIEPYAFNITSLKKLDFNSNNIQFSHHKELVVMFTMCRNLTFLDVSYNSLANLPDNFTLRLLSNLTNLRELKMRKMGLKLFPQELMKYLPHLTTLHLYSNWFSEKIFSSFQFLNNLKYLYIQNNYIRVIPKESFPENLRRSLYKLDLSYNPFDCSCDNRWFRDWIKAGRIEHNITIVQWPSGYPCRTPANMKHKRFVDFNPTDEMCSPIGSVTIILITIGVCLFVFSVSGVFVHRYIWYIRYVIYKMKKKSVSPETLPLLQGGEQRKFDGYIIYHDDDREFVHGDFLDLLETQNNYNVHVWHRNATNDTKLDVMVDGIYDSACVVAVVSRHFLQDNWCQFQLHVALDRQLDLRRDLLLLVSMEDIDYKSLSRQWCVVLTRTSNADWCSNESDIKRRVFEQRLKQHFDRQLRIERSISVSRSTDST